MIAFFKFLGITVMNNLLLPISFTTFLSLTMAADPLSENQSSREASSSEEKIYTWPLKHLDPQTIPSEIRNLYTVDDNGTIVFNLTQDQHSKYTVQIELCSSYPNVKVNIEDLPEECLVAFEMISFAASIEDPRDVLEDSLRSNSLRSKRSFRKTSKKSLSTSSTSTLHSVPLFRQTSDTNPLTADKNLSFSSSPPSSTSEHTAAFPREDTPSSFSSLERSLTAEDTEAFMRTEEYKKLITK